MRNDLGHQRVIVRRNRGARRNVRIHPDTRTGRPSRFGDEPRAWTEVAGGILGVHAALDRAAAPLDIGLVQAKTVAAGDRDLLGDQVHAGDDLGHRMLDLDPRVHLEEIKRLLLVDEELHRAGAAIGKALREAYGGLVETATQEFGQSGRGRFLDQFLIATLDRAVPLAQVDHASCAIAENLHLDVAPACDEALEVYARISKGGSGLRGGERNRGRQLRQPLDPLHASATAAANRLDEQRACRSAGPRTWPRRPNPPRRPAARGSPRLPLRPGPAACRRPLRSARPWGR